MLAFCIGLLAGPDCAIAAESAPVRLVSAPQPQVAPPIANPPQAPTAVGKPRRGANLDLQPWPLGFKLTPAGRPDLRLWWWFYEWNLFGAVNDALYTGGVAGPLVFSHPGIGEHTNWVPGIHLFALAVEDGIELRLEIRNETPHAWPELASMIPCLGAKHRGRHTPEFETERSYFMASDGLRLLVDDGNWRAMHFNAALRPLIDSRAVDGAFPWSERWPTSGVDATRGVLLRESKDEGWVFGVAWERFLAAQGHNWYSCLHLAVQVGPLAPGESRVIRGKIYLLKGTREDLLRRYEADFGVAAVGDGS